MTAAREFAFGPSTQVHFYGRSDTGTYYCVLGNGPVSDADLQLYIKVDAGLRLVDSRVVTARKPPAVGLRANETVTGVLYCIRNVWWFSSIAIGAPDAEIMIPVDKPSIRKVMQMIAVGEHPRQG